MNGAAHGVAEVLDFAQGHLWLILNIFLGSPIFLGFCTGSPAVSFEYLLRKLCSRLLCCSPTTSTLCLWSSHLRPFSTSTWVECVSFSIWIVSWSLPQWGAADAKSKVPSGENTELKCSPFKGWSRSVYSHRCYAYCQGFFPYFYPSSPFTCIFSKTCPDFSCVGCG